MSALTDSDLPCNDELLSEIMKSCLSLLPMSSGLDIAPGEAMVVEARSNYAQFPDKTYFERAASGCFEIDKVSLRPWKRDPFVLQSRARGDRTDLESIDELLRRVVLPSYVELVLTVRNVSSAPQKFVCGVASHISVVDLRRHLLSICSPDRRPLNFARWWWKEYHQRIVDLSEEETKKIEAALAWCVDGSPRRDLRVALD
jgi:hypothetical protein